MVVGETFQDGQDAMKENRTLLVSPLFISTVFVLLEGIEYLSDFHIDIGYLPARTGEGSFSIGCRSRTETAFRTFVEAFLAAAAAFRSVSARLSRDFAR